MSTEAILELIVSFVGPIAVVVVGLLLSRPLRRIEATVQRSQALITRRLALFDTVKASINRLYASCAYVGDWRERSPAEVLAERRETDQIWYADAAFWSGPTLLAYKAFVDVCVDSFRGRGKSAVLRADSAKYREALGDRWKEEWSGAFMPDEDRRAWLTAKANAAGVVKLSYSQEIVLAAYVRLMFAIARDLGVVADEAAMKAAMSRPVTEEQSA